MIDVLIWIPASAGMTHGERFWFVESAPVFVLSFSTKVGIRRSVFIAVPQNPQGNANMRASRLSFILNDFCSNAQQMAHRFDFLAK